MADPQVRADPVASSLADSALVVLAEVAAYLATGIDSDEAKASVAGALKRGLKLAHCRLWVRSADGSSFRPICAPGEAEPSGDEASRVRRWLDRSEPNAAPGAILVPLTYEGATLGLLEAAPSAQTAPALAQRVSEVLGNLLSPLLASAELSEDLAGEVALRTREIDAQRRFTAQIIDSLPVGLYVIDRQFRIQAWNRKRETGTQGVVRDEVLGRTVFDVLYRQPRELLRHEFDRGFETDKLAAVGQLAAGVMHEINNPLATITACLEALASRTYELPGGARQSFEEDHRVMESELGSAEE